MDDIRFSDGFDIPDRIAVGLTAWSFVAVVFATLLAYLALRSPLPLQVTAPIAVFVLAIGAALGWLSIAGRPVLEWAAFAVRFFLQPRGGVVVAAATSGVAPVAATAPDARIILLHPRVMARRTLPVGAQRIAVVSFEPGAGTTTIATALSCSLGADAGRWRRRTRRVALVDFHTARPGVARYLSLGFQRGLLELALANPEDRALSSHLVAHCSGVRVLCGTPHDAPQVWPLTSALVREVFREADMEGFEVLVADAGCGPTDLGSACVAGGDRILVVCTATPTGLREAYRCAAWIRSTGTAARVDYVINRMRRGVDVSQLEQDLRGRVLAEIPEDANATARSSARRRARFGPADIAFRRLAAEVRRDLETTS